MKKVEICQSCHMGSLRPQRTTYAAWHVGAATGSGKPVFILAPGLLAWVCSVCGVRIFGRGFFERLVLLAGQPVRPVRDGDPSNSDSRAEAGPAGGDPQFRRGQ